MLGFATRKRAALAACLILAGCSGTVTHHSNSFYPTPIQAAQAGSPTCLKTSNIQNDLGAQSTNAARQKAGLPFVRPSALLADVAASHACDMAKRGVMTHRGSGTPGPGARVKARGYRPMLTAENIAAGPFNLGAVLVAWNGSRSHLDNILLPHVRDYGIGQAISPDGRTRFWSAVYAAPQAK